MYLEKIKHWFVNIILCYKYASWYY